MNNEPVKTITRVQKLDADGNVVTETVWTTTVDKVKEPEEPRTGFYV